MHLSVIIPARNEARDLPLCLERLSRELGGRIEYEVILVDHGSTDSTVDIARSGGAAIINHPTAASISELRNTGVRHAQAEVLAFIDADVLLEPGWLEGLNEACSIIAAEPLTLCGELYGIGPEPSWMLRAWYDPAMRSHARFVPGGNMVVSRTLIDHVGGFDEGLETGEDADLCRRVEAAGGTVRRIPALVTDHIGTPRTIRRFLLREAWYGAGDFASWRTVRESKVAHVTLAWAGLHLLALALLPLRPAAALVCWLIAIALSAASALARYGTSQMITRTGMYYIYFAARSLAALRRLRAALT